MNNKRLEEVVGRRLDILEKIEYQRMEMADISSKLQHPFALVDHGLKGIRFVREHPGLLAGGMAALVAIRRMGIMAWIKKGWHLTSLYPVLFPLVTKYFTRRSSREHAQT